MEERGEAMSQHVSIPFHGMLAFTFLAAGFALPAAAAADARVSERYGKLSLQFEANRGQTHKDVHFLSRGAGYSLYLTSGEAVLVLSKPAADAKRVALRMSLVGAARKPQVRGLDELPGRANYFIGKDPAKWRTNVPTYARVHYREVYPGVDLVYYGNQRQLEYDFIVAPGADPKKIVLSFKGADKLEISAAGDLVLHGVGGDVRQHKPIIYQEIDGVRREIEGGYVRKGANRVGFQVAAYDMSRPLIIDPVVLSYSTYLGGASDDFGNAIAVDPNGAAYVTGSTTSINFPTAGAVQTSSGGGSDAFVTKLNPAGSALVYSAYLGGSDADLSSAIAVDAEGAAYVTGTTYSTNFPTTADAAQPAVAGTPDAFVTKLDPTGSLLVYSTYLGGTSGDFAAGIALDTTGNTYVTGQTQSSNFPTTAGAFQLSLGGCSNSYPFLCDAFVAKLNPTGSALVYSSYLGGSSDDYGYGIAVDRDGNAYVTGYTTSTNFPTTASAFQPTFTGPSTVFVAKVDAAGSSLVYSTYLGGGSEVGRGIAVDTAGNAYVTGYTTSANFPTTGGAFQPAIGTTATGVATGMGDAFLTKLNPAGSGLVYSTYLGGGSDDHGLGIAVDTAGNAYVTGSTDIYASPNFPTTPGAFQPSHGGGDGAAGSGTDAFFTQLNSTGSALVYSTYLGGRQNDYGSGIAVDAAGRAYLTGGTRSLNFPTTAEAFQPAFSPGTWDRFRPWDAFVAKFADNTPPPPAPTGSAPTRSEESAATEIGFWTTYGAETGSFSGGTIVASNVAASTAMFSFSGTAVSWIGVKCNVCGIAAVSIDGGAPTTVNTAGPGAPGSLTSESVFSASGLAAGASHTMVIAVTGMSTSGGAYVAVDAFDVTAGSATSPIVPTVVLPPPPVVVPPLPPVLGL